MAVTQMKSVYVLIIFISSSILGIQSMGACDSPQYLEIGQLGIVRCSFPEGFSSIHWYNTPDPIDDDPALNYDEDLTKSGNGVASGELDILPDGSLVIRNVTVKHEITFTVNKFNENGDSPDVFNVLVKTFVKPSTTCPIIEGCSCPQEMCFKIWSDKEVLVCEVAEVRPAMSLSWLTTTEQGDTSLPYELTVKNHTITHSTSATLSNIFTDPSHLLTFVCIAEDTLNLLEKYLSVILVYNRPTLETDERNPLSIEENSRMNLNCSDSRVDIVVWEKYVSKGSIHTLAVAHRFNNFSEVYDDDFSLDEKEGALVLSNTETHHEGTYRCTYRKAHIESVKTYQISVHINPVPAYPVVKGCDHSKYCVLTCDGSRGSLTCSVKGIRPEVQLEWSTFLSDVITFRNQRTDAKSNGKTYDVSVTAEYEIHETNEKRLTVECRSIEPDSGHLRLSTKIDLLLTFELNTTAETTDDGSIPLSVVIPVVIIAAAVVLLSTIVLLSVALCRKKQTPVKDAEENLKMIEKSGISEYDNLKSQLIDQLKQSYEVLYNSVQPIPYQQDATYHVDDLFVEGGVDCLIKNPLNTKDETKWKSLGSYHEILDTHQPKTNRYIIEAEPGTGKSTLVLQMAYEWCVGKSDAILGTPEILVLFKLMRLQNVSSIYEAIKSFILPRDSKLQVEDIRHILEDSSSAVFIFDGFDEYSDHEKYFSSDLSAILQNKMFPQFPVILTTRTDNLPKHFAPRKKRLRLTGFNREAQGKYLRKVVTKEDEDATEKLFEFLQDNTVLADLCQTPLFFVLYAHLSQTNDNLKDLTSVTMFFRYVISSFHIHLKKKVPEFDVTRKSIFETDTDELNMVAFESLCKNKRQTEWLQEKLESRLGKYFVDYYISVGILRQSEITETVDLPGTSAADHIQKVRKLRFYHALFCEWYAASHVRRILLQYNDKTEGEIDDYAEEEMFEFLEGIQLSNFHYVYRFACGLDPHVATRLMKYIRATEGSDKFATLCLLERNGSVEHIAEFIKDLCSRTTHIALTDSRLIQRSIQQLVNIAYTMEVKIEKLLLYESFHRVDISSEELVLASGLRLSNQNTIETLWIEEIKKELGKSEFHELLTFCLGCPQLQHIGIAASVLPLSINDEVTLQNLAKKNVGVKWYPSVVWYQLNLKSGQWQSMNTKQEITEDEYNKEVARLRTVKIGKGTRQNNA